MSSKLITKISAKSDKKPIFRIEKAPPPPPPPPLKDELDNIVKDNPVFQLELKNLDSFDLSSIQILHTLKKKLGDNFSYTAEIKEEVKTILNHSGFQI